MRIPYIALGFVAGLGLALCALERDNRRVARLEAELIDARLTLDVLRRQVGAIAHKLIFEPPADPTGRIPAQQLEVDR